MHKILAVVIAAIILLTCDGKPQDPASEMEIRLRTVGIPAAVIYDQKYALIVSRDERDGIVVRCPLSGGENYYSIEDIAPRVREVAAWDEKEALVKTLQRGFDEGVREVDRIPTSTPK